MMSDNVIHVSTPLSVGSAFGCIDPKTGKGTICLSHHDGLQCIEFRNVAEIKQIANHAEGLVKTCEHER